MTPVREAVRKACDAEENISVVVNTLTQCTIVKHKHFVARRILSDLAPILTALLAEARAEERERCAAVADHARERATERSQAKGVRKSAAYGWQERAVAAFTIAAAIRALPPEEPST